MPVFETKPRRVEATQFRAGRPLPDGVGKGNHHGQPAYFVVTAHNQQVFLEYGDWIVPEPDGRGFYPVKDDIFRERHQPVCTCGQPAHAHASFHDQTCAFAALE